jgi:Flp pilus assembly protein TadD
MFLHGGLLHIAFNMWCLWDLGALCESLYGRWTYAAVYLITGVAGGLASIGWNPSVLSVGASGAIFGLAGALIASFYLGEFSLPNIAIRGTLRSLVIFAVFNLGFGGLFGGIDNACHIGGLVSGLILGALIARLAPQQGAPLRRLAVIGVVVLAVIGSGFGVRQWRGGPMRMARMFESAGVGQNNSIAQLQGMIRDQPNSVEGHFLLARAYFERQQFSQAESEFKRVIELQPNNAGARFDLGLTYLNEKRLDEANAAFAQMVTQDPNSAEGHYGLGLVLMDQEKYQTALDAFKSAAVSGKELPGVFYEIGNAQAKLKMYDDAIASYLKEKDKNEDDPDLETALAEAYEAKGMTQQAQDARTKAAQLKNQRTER